MWNVYKRLKTGFYLEGSMTVRHTTADTRIY